MFCPVSPLWNPQEKIQLQIDKNERKWVEHGFQNDKIELSSCFYHLYQNMLPLFTINWPLFFKVGKKCLFFIKNFISIFSGQCPQCATLFWGYDTSYTSFAHISFYSIRPLNKILSRPVRSILELFADRLFRSKITSRFSTKFKTLVWNAILSGDLLGLSLKFIYWTA